jgi:DNA polymerase sigma
MGDSLESLLLSKYSPNQSSLHSRYYIYKLIKSSIYRALERKLIKVTVYGSLPLRTFLPEGDIDITVITSPEDLPNLPFFLQKIKSQLSLDFEVSNLQEIAAEVPLLKFTVFSTSVDISMNQIGGVRTLIFFEEVCRLFPKHLLKKSFIICKAWGIYFSRILGSANGGDLNDCKKYGR